MFNFCFCFSQWDCEAEFFREEGCIAKLLDTLRDWVLWCYNEKQAFRLLRIFQQQRMRMLNVSTVLCCICGKDVERTARVIHHCHLSGTLFGVAHSKCKLRARTTNLLPVFFHNLSRYVEHHILEQLKLKVSEELSAIAKTGETYFLRCQYACDFIHEEIRENCKALSIHALPR